MCVSFLARMYFYTILLFFCFHCQHCYASKPRSSKALIIMGASCSGKTTLSKKLLECLDDNWKLVELDAIEEKYKSQGISCLRHDLLKEVVQTSNQFLEQGCNIIIDTNIYDEQLEGLSASFKKFVLVYCPLPLLMERNEKRNIALQRNPVRARRVEQWVIKTFHGFEALFIKQKYDVCIDSSQMDVGQSCQMVLKISGSA